MPFPSGAQTITLTGTFPVPVAGTARAGRIVFTPSATLVDSTQKAIYSGGGSIALDADGKFSVVLLCTNDTDVQPTGWRWRVDEQPSGGPRRTYWIDLPSTLGATVDLSTLSPVSEPDGSGTSTPPTGPAGGALTGAYPNPQLSAATIASFDPAGAASAAQAAAAADATAKVAAHDADATSVHGIADTAALETQAGAQSKADTAQASATAAAATDATAKVNTHASAADPHADRAWAGGQFLPNAVITVTDFLASTPFAVAHRGSGGEFPEHTLAAYEGALAAGAKAIEVSCNITADGVLVAIHDTTLDRTTDHTGTVSSWTWAALREQVRATPQGLLGAGWSNQPLPTLREALDALYGRCVIFLEAKASAAVTPMLNLLADRYPNATRSIVYKTYYTDSNIPAVKAAGYTVWAYMDAGTTDGQLDAVDANVDLWGVPVAMTDSRISEVVARGKPVMAWEVHRHADVTRLTGLGVQGLMQSEWIYLNAQPQLASAVNNFTAQVSAPGTLGAQGYSEAYALQYDGAGGAHLNQVSGWSVLMGGHRAPDPNAHTISFSMKWDTLPASTVHSGIAFCKTSDDTYQFSGANPSGGYHVVMRAGGDMQLFRHTAGVTSGTQIGTIATPAPVAGAYMDFTVQATPTQIILTRTDVDPDVVLTVNDTTYRGRYWHLSNGSIASLTNKPTWRNLSIS